VADSFERRQVEPGAWAVVRETGQLFLADDAAVISRLLALKLAAQTRASRLSGPGPIREALLEERWADALVEWMTQTGYTVDVYEEYVRVWTDDDLDADVAAMEIRMSPIFDE
jgi:hypothetical protein